MSLQKTEVELRGPITPEEIMALQPKLKMMKSLGKSDRYILCFTEQTLRDQQIDLRARITNGQVELIVKRGALLGHVRSEHVVSCGEGQFLELTRLLAVCGFNEAVGCHRVSTRYQDGAVEFALIEVPGHSFFYEAEIMTDELGAEAAKQYLRQWINTHNLQTFSEEAFSAYVHDRLDKEANELLDLTDPASFDLLTKRLAAHTLSTSAVPLAHFS